MIRRHSSASLSESGSPLAARDTVLEADHPLLAEYLEQRLFDDGSERQTSTLLVFAQDGVWKGCLNDRAEEQCLWVSSDSIGGVLDALEGALDTTAPDWRRYVRNSKKK